MLDHYQGGKAAVMAAPGAGKTTLIAHLIAHWVQVLERSAEQILVLTFTDSAAQTFAQRIAALLPRSAQRPTCITIHSFCNQLLRQMHSDFSDRQLITEERRYAVLEQILSEWGLFSPQQDEARLVAEQLLPQYRLQPDLPWPQDLATLQQLTGSDSDFGPLLLRLPELVARYDQLLRQEQWIDYDLMIAETHRLLSAHPRLLQAVQARYPYMLEDEAQDSNALQGRLLELLAGPDGNLLRVGDPNQSIYRFSGADDRALPDFAQRYRAFPMAESNRASTPIMALANAFRRHYAFAFTSDLDLQPGFQNPEPGWIWVKAYTDRQQEMAHVQQACQALLAQNQSLAILCRTNLACRWIAEQLTAAGIPCTLHHDRSDDFFGSELVQFLSALTAFLLEPAQYYRLQQLLVLAGFSRRSLQGLFDPAELLPPQLAALAAGQYFHPAVPRRELQALQGQVRLLLDLLERSHYPMNYLLEWLQPLLPEASLRSQLLLLQSLWEQHSQGQPAGLVAFQRWLKQSGQRRIRQTLIPVGGQERFSARGTVHILTAHKAKGLEWDAVLMPLFQYGQPQGPGEHEARLLLGALQAQQPVQAVREQVSAAETAEALRLVYVGLTRARRFLCLTTAKPPCRPAGIYRGGISPVFESLQTFYREQKAQAKSA